MNLSRVLVGAALGAVFGALAGEMREPRRLRRRRARARRMGAPFDVLLDTPPALQWSAIGAVVAGVTAPSLPPAGA